MGVVAFIPVFADEAIVQMDEDDNVSAAILDLILRTQNKCT